MGKTIISVNSAPPKGITWAFRIVFVLTTGATFIIAGDPTIPDVLKVKIGVYLKALDFCLWGLGRGLGVKKEDYEEK